MATQGKISANVQGAFVGAILGFLCSEALFRPSLWGELGLGELLYKDALWGMAFAAFLGIGLGIVEGVGDRSWGKVRRGIGLGALLGMGAGAVGVPTAELFYQWGVRSGASAMLPRALGWGIMGAAVGIVQGAARNSPSTLLHGLLGGLMGGMAGGLVFDAAAQSAKSDIIARLLGLVAIGLAEGFAVGLVQEAFKHAWLTAVSGSAEGRNYFLDKPVTTLGSHELCDIKISGDPVVAPRQAEIKAKRGVYEVEDVAGNGQISVNLRPVKSAILGDGFLLQVGGQRFVMQIKGATMPLPRSVAAAIQPKQPSAPPKAEEGICEFCGGKKDPVTGSCACTPGRTGIKEEGFGAGEQTYADGPALVGMEGIVAGQIFRLDRSIVLIGRHSNNNIVLADDATVSRFHARLTMETEGTTIYDEGSSNGTFVNGERIYRRLLHPGDVVAIGKAVFRFEEKRNR
jgi:hypothetical protein